MSWDKVRRAQMRWTVECEECSVKCGAWRVQCEVWSVKFGVWRKQWEVRRVKCGLWSVECEVWSVKSAVWSVECEECSVKCTVWRKQWEVRSVKCGVWSLCLECEEWVWSVPRPDKSSGKTVGNCISLNFWCSSAASPCRTVKIPTKVFAFPSTVKTSATCKARTRNFFGCWACKTCSR